MRNVLKLVVDYIQIYNPLLGTETTFDVKKWNKENELLDYIVKIRMNKLTRNTNINTISKPINTSINNKSINKIASKPVNIIDEFLDLNEDEKKAIENINLMNKVSKVDKVKISKKRIL